MVQLLAIAGEVHVLALAVCFAAFPREPSVPLGLRGSWKPGLPLSFRWPLTVELTLFALAAAFSYLSTLLRGAVNGEVLRLLRAVSADVTLLTAVVAFLVPVIDLHRLILLAILVAAWGRRRGPLRLPGLVKLVLHKSSKFSVA